MRNYSVDGMSCGHCVSAVSKAIEAVDPEAKVEVDLDRKRVSVDTSAGDDRVREAIRSAGYEPAD